MKRLLLTTAICATLPFAAQADEFLVRADVTEATVFLGGVTEIVREVSLTVPQGDHDVLLALPSGVQLQRADIAGTGPVTLGSYSVETAHPIEEGALDGPDVAAARARVEDLEDQVDAVNARIAEAGAAVQAAALQRAYLQSVTAGGDNAAPFPTEPELLGQMLTTLGTQMANVAEAARLAEEEQTALREELAEVNTDLNAARTALNELYPFGTSVTVMRVPVSAEAEADVTLTLSHFSTAATWSPVYTLRLDSTAEELAVERAVTLQLTGNERWHDVGVSVSTADPGRERAPSDLSPQPARIHPPETEESRGVGFGIVQLGNGNAGGFNTTLARPSPAPAVYMAPVEVQAVGASLTYRLPGAVTITPRDSSRQPLDTLSFDVDLTNRAVPRHDATAFLVAEVENDSGEALLSGNAAFYRDGELLGEAQLGFLADGAETDLAFGALDHLQLDWRDLSRDEGQTGIFTSADTQVRAVEFSVENTSDEAEEVRLLYAVPFAEQEELELDLDLSVTPDERDVDGQRGVHAWELTLEPGETRTIRMDVEFSWPEGEVLDWRP